MCVYVCVCVCVCYIFQVSISIKYNVFILKDCGEKKFMFEKEKKSPFSIHFHSYPFFSHHFAEQPMKRFLNNS